MALATANRLGHSLDLPLVNYDDGTDGTLCLSCGDWVTVDRVERMGQARVKGAAVALRCRRVR